MVKQTLNHFPSWLLYILNSYSFKKNLKARYWGLGKMLYYMSHHSIYGKFVTMTSFPRPTLLTRTSPCTSICHDLEDSSPKSDLNYPVWLTESHTTPFFQTPVSQKNTNPRLKRKQLTPRQPLNLSGFQTPPGSLSPGCSAPCPCFSLKDCHPLYILIQSFYSRESAWSRCCTDPIISMSDGLPGS